MVVLIIFFITRIFCLINKMNGLGRHFGAHKYEKKAKKKKEPIENLIVLGGYEFLTSIPKYVVSLVSKFNSMKVSFIIKKYEQFGS